MTPPLNRVPSGSSDGGQFAPTQRHESGVTLHAADDYNPHAELRTAIENAEHLRLFTTVTGWTTVTAYIGHSSIETPKCDTTSGALEHLIDNVTRARDNIEGTMADLEPHYAADYADDLADANRILDEAEQLLEYANDAEADDEREDEYAAYNAELRTAIENAAHVKVTTDESGWTEVTAWASPVNFTTPAYRNVSDALASLRLRVQNNPTVLDEDGERALAEIVEETEQMLEFADDAEQRDAAAAASDSTATRQCRDCAETIDRPWTGVPDSHAHLCPGCAVDDLHCAGCGTLGCDTFETDDGYAVLYTNDADEPTCGYCANGETPSLD